MTRIIGLALLAVLASSPWYGVGYHHHVGWLRIPFGNAVMVRPVPIPICLHMRWTRSPDLPAPPPGTLRA